METIKEMLKTTPEHILRARDMAESIFREPSSKHEEMLSEIKKTLINLHEIHANKLMKA